MGAKERLTCDVSAENYGTGVMDDKVVLNVGGVRHTTWLSTLECVPGTRLALIAHLQKADESYDAVADEYFFDRHPRPFEYILDFYRTGELHIDQSICGNTMRLELEFWGLEESEIEPCCWAVYSRNTEHKQTLAELDENFAYATDAAWAEEHNCKKWQIDLWTFLEEPNSSRGAKVYAFVSMFFVALSIVLFVLETHKLFQIDRHTGKSMMDVEPDDKWTPTGSPLSCCCEQEYNRTRADPETHPALLYLDYVCIAFFIVELALRFVACPWKKRFFKDVLNVIDLVCIVPYLASIIMRTVEVNSSGNISSLLKIVIMLRIVRILRIFKLMKHYSAFKILVYTLKVSTKELFLMVVFLMSGVLMFASLIHYIEKDNFPNIPIGIWWALVTMTTVGYGDKYTVSYGGYAVGSICVICGVLVIAFTVPIVVNNFSLYYSHAQTRIKAPSKKKRREKTTQSLKDVISRKQKQLKSRTSNTSSRDTGFDSVGHRAPSLTSRETTSTFDDSRQLVTQPTTVKTSKFKRMLQHAKKTGFAVHTSSATSARSHHAHSTTDSRKTSTDVTDVTPRTAREVTLEDIETSGSDSASSCDVTESTSKPSTTTQQQTRRQEDFAEQTKQIMEALNTHTELQQNERKRQEISVNQRRAIRKKKLQQQSPPTRTAIAENTESDA